MKLSSILRKYINNPLKWGVVAAGNISHDFVTAVQTYPVTNHKFVAITARSKDRAEKFAKEHGIPKFYEGYKDLAKDNDVDIVYVGNMNPDHFEAAKIMLENGKHVLCEKPMTVTSKQTMKLIEIAKKKNVLLMEGIWSRHFPAYQEMRRLIKNGIIGDVLFAIVSFGFNFQHVERFVSKELGGGSVTYLAIYVLQFQQLIFEGLTPLKIVVNGHLNQRNTDDTSGAIITYPNGKTAIISVTTRAQFPNEGVIVGTKGTLKLPMFWCPTKLITPEGTKEWPLPEVNARFNYENSIGLRYQAEHARLLLAEGKRESDIVPYKDSIELAKLMDLMRKEVGNVFPEDSQQF